MQLCQEFETGSTVSVHKVLALEAMGLFYKIIERNGYVPPESELVVVRSSGMFLLHYNFITQRSLVEGHLLYNMVNKHHMFWHVAHQATRLNPRHYWAPR